MVSITIKSAQFEILFSYLVVIFCIDHCLPCALDCHFIPAGLVAATAT